METGYIKERFLAFAESECKGNSELYYQLSIRVSNDDELLKIAAFTRTGQPIPNIFFAAVHYLLLKNPGHELAKYYPSIQKNMSQKSRSLFLKSFVLNMSIK